MNNEEPIDHQGSDSDENAHSNGTPTRQTDHDIFRDPALSSGGSQDPALEFLKKHWLNLVYLLIAVIAITYAVTTFHETFEQDLRSSADTLLPVRESLQKYRSAKQSYEASLKESVEDSSNEGAKKTPQDPKAKESERAEREKRQAVLKEELDLARTALTQQILESANESVDPYKQFGDLYLVDLAREERDVSGLKGKIADAKKWSEISDSGSIERLQGELLALNVGRGLLDIETERADGRALLIDLSQQGSFVAVPATLAVADTAQSDEENANALQLLLDLRTRAPYQGSLLEEHIKRLQTIIHRD